MFVQNGVDALFQPCFGGLGGEAEIEFDVQLARNDIGCACAAVDIGNLKAGRREVFVAFVPDFLRQLLQRRGKSMHGIDCQMRIGNMALLAFDGQVTRQ